MFGKSEKSLFKMPGGDRGGKRRSQRVSDVILSEVAMLLLKTITDPRLKRLTLTSVRMTEDLRIARVFFDCNEENAAQVQAGLDSAKGFIRSHLARALKLRIAPDLEFRRDLSIVRQEEMERILKEIREDNDSDSG